MKYVSSPQCSYSRRQRKDAIRVVKALENHNLAVLESCMEFSRPFKFSLLARHWYCFI